MPRFALLTVPIIALSLGGCVAGTLVDVATMPVRAAGQMADWATTSQDESDRARGREIRRREERLGRLERDYAKHEEDCVRGRDNSCRDAVAVRREMEALMPTVPLERDTDG